MFWQLPTLYQSGMCGFTMLQLCSLDVGKQFNRKGTCDQGMSFRLSLGAFQTVLSSLLQGLAAEMGHEGEN